MVKTLDFLPEIGKKLRPQAIAVAVDTGQYIILWVGILIAQLVKILIALTAIDPDVIRAVSFMEKWVWIASFAAFFIRTLLRLFRQPQD